MEEDIKLLEKINITTYGTKEELEIDLSEEELNQIIKNLINKYKEQEEQIKEYKNKTLENDLATAQASGMFAIMESLKRKCEEQEKIIELMAKEMSEEDENFLYRNTSDIIDYFKKKARENNANNNSR